jgi:hypothetical protein
MVGLQIILATTYGVNYPALSMASEESVHSPTGRSLALYALSRGRGVPERTKVILEQARLLLEDAKRDNTVVSLIQEPIGIEGESRLCAEFVDDVQAQKMYQRLSDLTKGAELLNLQSESCR